MIYMISKDDKTILGILKALANPIRLHILKQLNAGEQCVCSIVEKQKLSQNLASHHLAILRENKLIVARKEGKWVHYSLNHKKLILIQSFIEFISIPGNKKSKC